jgi:hypothetical protein
LKAAKLARRFLMSRSRSRFPPTIRCGDSQRFITAHYAGAHPEYNAEADAIFLDNLRLYLAGEALHHVVDKEAGY